MSYRSPLTKTDLPINFDLNGEFKAAFNLMENSNDCIFITGKAGTGKSTLLQYFRQNTCKKVVVLAPTGVAAINVNGQTIHSFFKFPPKLIQEQHIRRRRNPAVMQELDTVIIDEASMVRADLMSGVDYALRINRDRMNVPFGGAQVILFGDLYQLSPVVEREMREVMDRIYQTPYFFSAKVFDEIALRHFELKKIYRQQDIGFIGLLEKIRNKKQIEFDLEKLNKRVISDIATLEKKNIILTTTNNNANKINLNRLAKLPYKEYTYDANIFGKFGENSFPAEGVLKLKKEAQIILIKNDPDKRWVNGTICTIKSLSDTSIKVSIGDKVCEVPKVTWDKIEYTYNWEEQKIEENVIGTFEQYPIRLAWAVTIHKSQGQTFDNVTIDLHDGAFAHGQVYVALSRCTRLDGISLRRPVIYSDIIFDERIYQFKKRGHYKKGVDPVIKS